MRKLLLSFCTMLLAFTGFAQATYTVRQVQNGGFPNSVRTGSILDSYGWKEVLAPRAIRNSWSANQQIPFPFQFYGAPVSKLKVSGNLLATFDTTTTLLPGENTNLPHRDFPDKTIAVFWDDFSGTVPLGAQSRVLTKTFGTAPNRQYWVVWFAYNYGSDFLIENSFNALVLEEGSNKIYIVDQYTQDASWSTTVGLQLDPATGVQFGDSTLSMDFNSMSVSDIDYYVFTPKNVTPADAGITTIVAPNAGRTGCYTASEDVQVTITNYGTAALTTVPVTVTVSGVLTQTLSGVYSGSIASGDSVVFTVGQVDMSQGGSFTFAAATQLPGDGDAANDAMQKIVYIEPVQSLPTKTITFTGYDGDNLGTIAKGWHEKNRYGPGGAWFEATQGQKDFFGTETARVALHETWKKEYIVSPVITIQPNAKLYYKAAITQWDDIIHDHMGFDDSVNILVSTDCGANFSRIKAITDADSIPGTLTQYVVDLSAFSGQDVVIAFYGTDGDTSNFQKYNFHLDDIQVKVPGANDAGVAGLLQPQITGCAGNAENIEVSLVNMGTNALTNIPVTVTVTGPNPQTYQVTYPGPLAPGATASFIAGTLDMTAGGSYTFNVSTNVANDSDTTNNNFAKTIEIEQAYALPLPKVTFTGYDAWADNLPQLTNNTWRQFSPNGTWAGFTTSSPAQQNWLGSQTAKVNLFAAFKDEWLYGPKFRAVQNAKLFLKAAVTQWDDSTSSAMGADDTVHIKISTDCGTTFQTLATFTAASNVPNVLTPYDFDLSAYAGQDIIIAINASDGFSMDTVNYDFHLDDIQVKVNGAADGALTDILSPLPSGCYNSTEAVEVVLFNGGNAPIFNFPVTVTTTGALTQTITTTFTDTLAAGDTTNFVVGIIDMSQPGNYNITATAQFPLDTDSTNNTLTISRTSIPGNTLPLQPVTFDGYDGWNLQTIANGWYESEGSGMPSTGVREGEWVPSELNQSIGLGSQTAKMNMAGSNMHGWIIGPKFNASSTTRLVFKAAVTSWDGISSAQMGADDTLHIMYSSDCGLSFKRFSSISAATQPGNALQQYDLDLSAFAGNEVVIGFYASNGTVADLTTYDIHLDDIYIKESAGTDVGVVALTPASGCSLGAAEPVTIQVVNFGTTPQQNIPVSYSVNGNTPVTGVVSTTINPGDTVSYTFAGTVNLSQALTYSFEAFTSLASDSIAANDAFRTTVTSVPTHQVLVNQPISIDFEDSTSSLLNFKHAANSEAGIMLHEKAANPTGGMWGLVLEGKTFDHWYITNGNVSAYDAWVLNYKHHAYASMCIDASAVPNTQLNLNFDLKQTYASDSLDSWFRVLVNGVPVTGDFHPKTPEDDTMKTHTVDLSAYAGTSFEITFQSSNKFAQWQGVFIGNDALLDNILVNSRVVGVKEEVEKSLALYPNPTTGMVNVDLSHAGKAFEIQLYNLQGQLLQRSNVGVAKQYQLDLSEYSSGLYLVKVLTTDQVLTQKIVLHK